MNIHITEKHFMISNMVTIIRHYEKTDGILHSNKNDNKKHLYINIQLA